MFDFPLVIVTLSQFHYDPSYRIYTKGPSKQYTFKFEQRAEPPNCRGLFQKELKALKCQTLGATAHVHDCTCALTGIAFSRKLHSAFRLD